jgi:hypothetical protein
MEFDELLKGLKSDLREKVKKPKSDEEDFSLYDAIGKIIEGKGLKPDLRNPETIKILEGTSNEIVQEAARGIWRNRKDEQKEKRRGISGGIHCEDREIHIKETVVFPSDYEKINIIERPRITKKTITRMKRLIGNSELDAELENWEMLELDRLEQDEVKIDKVCGKHFAKIRKYYILHDYKVDPVEISRDLDIPLATVKKRLGKMAEHRRRVMRRLKKRNNKKLNGSANL